MNRLLKFSHMGMYFAMIFALFVFIGMYADKSYPHIKPFGTIAGALIGFPLAFYRLLLMAREMQAELEEENQQRKNKPE